MITNLDPTLQGMVNKWSYKSPVATYVFDREGDFSAVNAALYFAKNKGMSCGTMDGDNPIACAIGNFHIGKWHTILREHFRSLSGIILSSDFRKGPCVFVEFNKGQ